MSFTSLRGEGSRLKAQKILKLWWPTTHFFLQPMWWWWVIRLRTDGAEECLIHHLRSTPARAATNRWHSLLIEAFSQSFIPGCPTHWLWQLGDDNDQNYAKRNVISKINKTQIRNATNISTLVRVSVWSIWEAIKYIRQLFTVFYLGRTPRLLLKDLKNFITK